MNSRKGAKAQSETDLAWMKRAIELARRGEGLTRPNPPVGAVIVKNGRVIGEGWHRKAGGPHAEVYALRQAGAAAYGATLYVTLEPCSTTGRTPPCTDAILAAGIKRVVVGCTDPNPKHAGRGLSLLMQHGIEVTRDVGHEEARSLIAPFAMVMTRRRPFVTLKLAMTLDGKIADAKGASKWITGEASRKLVQDLRRRADAILVGVGTVNADDPSLLPRPSKGREPFRVVVDTNGRVNSDAKIFSDGADSQTLIATVTDHVSALGDVILLPKKNGQVSLPVLMKELAGLGVLHVVCEGGGELAASLVSEKLVDELWLFIAPKIFGGARATSAFGGAGWLLKNAPGFQISDFRNVGGDLLIKARRA